MGVAEVLQDEYLIVAAEALVDEGLAIECV